MKHAAPEPHEAVDLPEAVPEPTPLPAAGAAPPALLPWPARWAVAGAALGAAILIRLALNPVAQHRFPFAALYGAVVVSVWFAGTWAAMVVAVTGYAISTVWFAEPQSAGWSIEAAGAVLYALSVSAIIGFGAFMRRERERANGGEHRAQRELLRRHDVEDALRRANARSRRQFAELEAIYHAAPLGLCVLDPGMRFRRINRRLAEMNGATVEQHLGRHVREIIPHVAAEGEAAMRRILETGQPLRFELRGETPAEPGVEHVWDEFWYPLRDGGGHIFAVGLIVDDVTERRRNEQAVRDAQEQVRRYAADLEKVVEERTARLRDTVQELEAFSYSIAHDMRAPLRAMVGYSDILRGEHAASLDPQAREYLARIAAAALRLDQFIKDILNYGRIVREELHLSRVDVGSLLAEILETYPNLQRVRDQIIIAAPIPPVMANVAALTQVFGNLLDNAAKFGAPGAALSIQVRAESVPPEPGSADDPGWVRLWVEDNGIGIEPSFHPRLFHMFQRFNAPGKYDGTGIGLAIVRKATERMGGHVGVQSEPGKGSRFWILLRAAPAPAGMAELRPPS